MILWQCAPWCAINFASAILALVLASLAICTDYRYNENKHIGCTDYWYTSTLRIRYKLKQIVYKTERQCTTRKIQYDKIKKSVNSITTCMC